MGTQFLEAQNEVIKCYAWAKAECKCFWWNRIALIYLLTFTPTLLAVCTISHSLSTVFIA